MDNKFVVDFAWGYCLEENLNRRARDGWLLLDISSHSQPDDQNGPTFTIVWYKPPEGFAVPVGYKVV